MTSELLALAPGLRVTGNITLVRQLGAGGMGAVWIADHAGLKTRVVVKFMLSELGTNTEAQVRFSREAAAAAQVKSPHVVQMLDHGYTDQKVPFIVMEHLEGKSLGEYIDAHGSPPPAETALIVLQVAKALTRVHAAGLLHRDIKPDNIFLCEGEDETFVKLLDFGIAKSQTGDVALDGQTKTGQVVGTPFYMSPEQVNAEKTIDARSDLWALAVVAYEAFTGTRPFDGPSFGALAVAIVTTAPPKPSALRTNLPHTLDTWFDRALARDREKRFATAKEFSDGLRAAFGPALSLSPASGASGSATSLHPLSDSSPRNAVDSHAKTENMPTPIGLESTISQDSSPSAGALARSEPSAKGFASVPVDAEKKSGVKPARIIIAAALAAMGVVIIFGIYKFTREPEVPTASAPSSTSSTPFGSASPLPSVPSSHAETIVEPPASVALTPSSEPSASSAKPGPRLRSGDARPGGSAHVAASVTAVVTVPPPPPSAPPRGTGDPLF